MITRSAAVTIEDFRNSSNSTDIKQVLMLAAVLLFGETSLQTTDHTGATLNEVPLSVGAIVGGVIAIVLVLLATVLFAIIILLTYYTHTKKRYASRLQ